MSIYNFTFVNSPLFFDGATHNEDTLPPLGLAYLSSALTASGISNSIYDPLWQNKSTIEAIENIKQEKHVGINIFSVNIEIVKYIIESCQDTHFILGGGASQHILKIISQFNNKNTTVIAGEADLILPALIQSRFSIAPERTVNGTKYYEVKHNSTFYPRDINSLLPERTKLASNGYYNNIYGDIETGIISGRGCLYDCRFCGSARSSNTLSKPRLRSASSIIEELDLIEELNKDVQCIRFLDDLFLYKKKRNVEILKYFKKSRLYWRAMVHVSIIDGMTDQELIDLRDSGCKELFLGVESGSLRIIKFINKKHTPSKVKNAVRRLTKTGINVKCYFIYGFPNESIADQQLTLRLARELYYISLSYAGRFRTSAFKYRPYHGTWLYEHLQKQGVDINFKSDYELTKDIGREQFNITSTIHSKPQTASINKFIKQTLELNSNEELLR